MPPVEVTVVIPSVRDPEVAHPAWQTVCAAAANCPRETEVVISLDRPITPADREFAAAWPSLRLVGGASGTGSAATRLRGIAAAEGQTLLFTDDDCWVPEDWVISMAQAAERHGVVSGMLVAREPQYWTARLEGLTDELRVLSTTSDGQWKYVSFPNMAIRRELLPSPPYTDSPSNTAEDFELAARLLLAGSRIEVIRNVAVSVVFPRNFKDVLRRKRKHARGVAFVCQNAPPGSRDVLEVTSAFDIARRWIAFSLRAPLTPLMRVRYLLINLAYCGSLAYYLRVQRSSQ